MGILRRNQVEKLVAAAGAYQAAVKRKGWKADAETDRLLNTYNAARRNSSHAELSEFQRIHGDAEYADRAKYQN